MNAWEVCPKCKGTGTNYSFYQIVTCDVCNGQKIISSITGKPPQITEQELKQKAEEIIANQKD